MDDIETVEIVNKVTIEMTGSEVVVRCAACGTMIGSGAPDGSSEIEIESHDEDECADAQS